MNAMDEDMSKDEKICLCCFCGKTYKDKNSLDKHLLWHKDEICYCLICGKGFRTKVALSVHKQFHRIVKGPEGELTLECEDCNKRFVNKVFLKRHMRKHTRNKHSTKTLQCHICGKGFSQQITLDNHILVHEGRQSDIKRPFGCEICGKRYLAKGALKLHKVRTHMKDKLLLKCEKCEKIFAQMVNLKAHEMVHSLEEGKVPKTKEFICEICYDKFEKKDDFQKHLSGHEKEQTRDKNIPFGPCKVCGQVFSLYGGAMAIHMKTHTNEKAFKCKTCSKAFTVKRYLDTHEKIHTGVKSFVCELCGKGFNLKGNLKKHKQKNSCSQMNSSKKTLRK